MRCLRLKMVFTVIVVLTLGAKTLFSANRRADDNIPQYFVFPIKTELQRSLIPYRADVYVLVNKMEALKSQRISLQPLSLPNLKKDLEKLRSAQTRLHFNLFANRDYGDVAGGDILRYSMIGIGHELGFARTTALHTMTATPISWSDYTAGIRGKADPETADEKLEVKDSAVACSVRTKLSRYLADNADCVVIISKDLTEAKGKIPENVRKDVMDAVKPFDVAIKLNILFGVRYIKDEHRELLRQNLNELGQELGFGSCSVREGLSIDPRGPAAEPSP